jgi:hypothetical protein
MSLRHGLFLALLGTIVGCSDKSASSTGDCADTSDCQPGEVCIQERCRRLCRADRDCAESTNICVEEVCVDGTRANKPTITAIDGDGTADGANGHTAHLIDRRIMIRGENFDGADVSLVDNTGETVLEVCAAASDTLTVALPPTLATGTYLLRVTSQAGACDANLPVLQGQPGNDGSPDTGDQIVGKINSSASVPISASKVGPVDAVQLGGHDPSYFAVGTHDHVATHPMLRDGSALAANPWFQSGATGWSLSNASVITDTTAPAGRVVANTANQVAVVLSSTAVVIDPRRTYVVRGMFKNSTAASAGRLYLLVALADATGTNIGGDGTYWYYPASFIDLTDTAWHAFSGRFGWYSGRPFPAAAVTMTIGAILNFDSGGNPGNRIQEVTGLTLEAVGAEQDEVRQRIERYASICNTMAWHAGYANGAAVTPGDATINMTGN